MGGIEINRFVNSLFSDYDRNNNGSIELKNSGRDEAYFDRREVKNTPQETTITITRYSHDQLFNSADTNKDNKVTKEELTSLVSKFDKNNDGKLNWRNFWEIIQGKPKGDFEVFDDNYPERKRVIHRQVIPHHPSYPPGYPNYPLNELNDMNLINRQDDGTRLA